MVLCDVSTHVVHNLFRPNTSVASPVISSTTNCDECQTQQLDTNVSITFTLPQEVCIWTHSCESIEAYTYVFVFRLFVRSSMSISIPESSQGPSALQRQSLLCLLGICRVSRGCMQRGICGFPSLPEQCWVFVSNAGWEKGIRPLAVGVGVAVTWPVEKGKWLCVSAIIWRTLPFSSVQEWRCVCMCVCVCCVCVCCVCVFSISIAKSLTLFNVIMFDSCPQSIPKSWPSSATSWYPFPCWDSCWQC